MTFFVTAVKVLLCATVIASKLSLIESSKTKNIFNYTNHSISNDSQDNHNKISTYNEDDLITLNGDHHMRTTTNVADAAATVKVDNDGDDDDDDDHGDVVDVDGGPSSLYANSVAAFATNDHNGRLPLWFINQRPVRQQVGASAAATATLVSVTIQSPATYHGHVAAAAATAITNFNNEHLKLNKLKANDDNTAKAAAAANNVGDDSHEVAAMLQQQQQQEEEGVVLQANNKNNFQIVQTDDIELDNDKNRQQEQQWQKLLKPQPSHNHHYLKFYASNTYHPLSFGQLPQFQQQQPLQLWSLPSPALPQVYLDNSHQHLMADYRLLYNAERNTEFYLYTMATTAVGQMSREAFTTNTTTTSSSSNSNSNTTTNTTHGRVLHVVSDTISAAFGVNTHSVAGIQGIRIEELQLYNAQSLRQSSFNPFNPTRILIHGWLGGSSAGIYNTLIPEFLKLGQGTYNVITVDWGKGAIADYITASYRVKPVGKMVAKLIDFLIRESGTLLENIHLVGFSMGAHVAGIAGKYVQCGRLPVIYALDPALQLFRYENINERVDISDADYVEVIHTSAGSYGYDRPLGHVDFYVNYGSYQPGCYFYECSHFRGFQIFAQSLNNEKLQGNGCSENIWQNMIKLKRCEQETGSILTMNAEGLSKAARLTRRGVYYLVTNPQPPYKL